MMKSGFCVIFIFLTIFLVSCSTQKNKIDDKIILCPPCAEAQCSPMNVVKEIIVEKNNTVYVHDTKLDCSPDKASWYLELSSKQMKGYRDEYLAKRYMNCTRILTDSTDSLMTALGFYAKSDLVPEYMTYNTLYEAEGIMLQGCSTMTDGSEINLSLLEKHDKKFSRYINMTEMYGVNKI